MLGLLGEGGGEASRVVGWVGVPLIFLVCFFGGDGIQVEEEGVLLEVVNLRVVGTSRYTKSRLQHLPALLGRVS